MESFKESSGRWKADAEAKWRQLKRASESVANEAKTCRQAGDAAERELATLKIAGGRSLMHLLATHPPLEARIAALEGRSS